MVNLEYFGKNKINVKVLLLIMCCAFTMKLPCQTYLDEDINRKYWYYNSHFNNDFIKIGLANDESIPFNEKNNQTEQSFCVTKFNCR